MHGELTYTLKKFFAYISSCFLSFSPRVYLSFPLYILSSNFTTAAYFSKYVLFLFRAEEILTTDQLYYEQCDTLIVHLNILSSLLNSD